MGLNAKNKQGADNRVAQPNIDPGVYPGRMVQLIDLGVQPQREFQGKAKPPIQELMFTYELVDEFMKDDDGDDVEDKPRWISETLPFHGLFADKAKSTQRYYAFDPMEEFDGDFTKAIGMPINITIVNNKSGDKVYDNIANVAAMRPKDAAACPELKNPPKVFDLTEPDMEVYSKLPKWIQEKIVGNLEYKGSLLEAALAKAPQEAPKEEKAKPAKKNREAPPADDADDNPY